MVLKSQKMYVDSLKENDIVLLKTDENRSALLLARVLQLYTDENGITGMAEIMVRGQRTLRTVKKLVPLECSSEPIIHTTFVVSKSSGELLEGNDSDAATGGKGRPVRVAVQRSRNQWLNLFSGGHVA